MTIVCGGLAATTVLIAGFLFLNRILNPLSKIKHEYSSEQIQILQEKLIRLQIYKDDLMSASNREGDLDDRIKALNAEIEKVQQELSRFTVPETQKAMQPGNEIQRDELNQKMVRLLILRDEILKRQESPERASALLSITDEIRSITRKMSELK